MTVTNKGSVVTLANPLAGKVTSVNRELRFVVVDFSFGQLPAADQRLGVYRQGLKVGEVKIDAAYARDGLVVADVVAGEAKEGDEVRRD